MSNKTYNHNMDTSNKLYAYVLDKTGTEIVNILNSGRDAIPAEFKAIVDGAVKKADKYINMNVYYNQDVPMVMNVVHPNDLYTNILYNVSHRPGRALLVNGVVVLEGYCREHMDTVIKRVQDRLAAIDVASIEFSREYS